MTLMGVAKAEPILRRLPQIPHHQPRGLVDERFNRFTSEHVGARRAD
jgi:hypothetical protein